eukprot:GCRY01004233.1.p1 GENE.GCRY01004233.1~~GCRY01004233.1.p1  ORF type:complete len:216 (+),score=50.98 GCRY01004233.1:163-810(+)
MKALVSVKRVIEHSVKIRLKQGAAGVLPTVDTLGVKMSINPFDEVAIEEAVRLKEKGIVKEVVAFSVGDKKASDTLRTALALGADRACHVLSEDADAQPLTVAKLLSTYVEVERPDLVLMGKQSIDGDNVQTPQMLAGLLNWPQATFASKIDWSEDNSEVLVVREVSAGLETVRLPLPAVISVDLRLNTPRYPTLPAVMKVWLSKVPNQAAKLLF